MQQAVGSAHGPTAPLHATDLSRPDPDGYACPARFDDQRILLIDDVYTAGIASQSAAHTLTGAGATIERIAAIGRQVNPQRQSRAQ